MNGKLEHKSTSKATTMQVARRVGQPKAAAREEENVHQRSSRVWGRVVSCSAAAEPTMRTIALRYDVYDGIN